jgi:hypothetical protein
MAFPFSTFLCKRFNLQKEKETFVGKLYDLTSKKNIIAWFILTPYFRVFKVCIFSCKKVCR